MSNIGLTCDVCGRTVQGITYVNGMKFCAKCYQETFGNNSLKDCFEQLINTYRKLNDELGSENTELRMALRLASDTLASNDQAYKIKSKQKTTDQHYKQLLKKAKERLREGEKNG